MTNEEAKIAKMKALDATNKMCDMEPWLIENDPLMMLMLAGLDDAREGKDFDIMARNTSAAILHLTLKNKELSEEVTNLRAAFDNLANLIVDKL